MKYFDYIYYRIYSYYHKNKDTPNFTAILFLLVLQACVLFFVVMTINEVADHEGVSTFLNKEQFWFLYWIIVFALLIVDITRYAGKQKVAFYISLFKENHLNKTIPTWMVFIQPLIFILLTIFINVIVKNTI
jgi:hypothetical protein